MLTEHQRAERLTLIKDGFESYYHNKWVEEHKYSSLPTKGDRTEDLLALPKEVKQARKSACVKAQ